MGDKYHTPQMIQNSKAILRIECLVEFYWKLSLTRIIDLKESYLKNVCVV